MEDVLERNKPVQPPSRGTARAPFSLQTVAGAKTLTFVAPPPEEEPAAPPSKLLVAGAAAAPLISDMLARVRDTFFSYKVFLVLT